MRRRRKTSCLRSRRSRYDLDVVDDAYTDAEKAEIVKKLEGKKLSINRSKGLGENDPEMMWMTTMNPATRRLIKVMPEDMERTMQVFDLLLGDNLQGRKDHIAENGYKYLDQLDVS